MRLNSCSLHCGSVACKKRYPQCQLWFSTDLNVAPTNCQPRASPEVKDYHLKSGIAVWILDLMTSGETVEKAQMLRF